ncbi:RidA family protein [Brucella pseudogrignonensis]|uniref:RidA family protein n=1 Tax=Brucella TaxID=234 RepID=UPI0028B55FF3|nr:RidA family protein [Brucella pseudogrignonensis]MDT6942153.1 RidA family protein [Brucella pseudogrignonensis]
MSVIIETKNAPAPAGHYAQAISNNGTVWISGQLPIRPDGSHCESADFEVQAHQAVSNLLAILEAAGGSPSHLVKVTAYITGVENWPVFNRVYAGLMGSACPARAIVPVPELHYGFKVEVEGCAVIPENQQNAQLP